MKLKNIALAFSLTTILIGFVLLNQQFQLLPKVNESGDKFSIKDDPYASAENYFRFKKHNREKGYHKLDAPEEIALIERAKRTPNDLTSPEYAPNQRLDELKTARSGKEFKTKSLDLNFIERGPGNIAGRTRALLVLPNDPDAKTWLAGSASGGIWKTTNGGQTWIDKTPDFPNLGTNTLAMSKSDPNIIYAGTGEHFTADIDGVGMFKSLDQGETWTQIVVADQYDAFRNVSRIAVHPEDPDIVIATTRNSVFEDSLRAAIYKSTDGGQSWEQLLFSIRDRYDDIAVNPMNFNTLYVAIRGHGVIKSMDQGKTWVDNSLGLQVTGRIEIATSPVDTNYVWASAQGIGSGSGSDLYQSKDGGALWKLAIEEQGAPIHFLTGQGWYDNVIEAHPFDKNVVYVGGVNLFKMRVSESEILDVIYSIRDEGAFSFLDFINGTQIGGGILEGNLEPAEVVSIQLRFGQGGQKAHRFTVNGRGAGVPAADYQYLDNVDIPFQAWDIDNNRQLMVSFRDQSEDGQWTLKERALDASNTAQDSREYIFIHDVDYADTADVQIAMAGGHEFRQLSFMWPVLRPGANFNPNTTDNASSFSINAQLVQRQAANTTAISDAYGEFNRNNGFSNEQFSNNKGHHPDQHSLQFIIVDSINRWFKLLTTNDGGVYVSNTAKDPGTTNNSFNYAGFRYNTSQFYSADKMPGADRYFGGMQDNSTWFSPVGISANAQSVYEFAFGGDGFESIWNNRDPNLMIGSVQFNSFRRSSDQGKTWTLATDGITDAGPFVSRLANHRGLPERIFTVGSSGVWVSKDFGLNWKSTPIQDMWSFNNSTDIEVSTSNPDIVWAGGALDDSERLFVSVDGGISFEPTSYYEKTELGTCSGIGVHPASDSTAYALFSFARRPKVLRTTDLGNSWEDISGFEGGNGKSTNGFPDVAVNCLLVFPNDNNRIWVGSEIGLIESLDNGATWQLLNSNLPSVNISDMKIQDDQIIIATYGRGIWSVQVDGIARTYVFAPSISFVSLSPDGTVSMDINLSSLYDSISIAIENVELAPVVYTDPTILGSDNFRSIFDILSIIEDGNYSFYVIGYKDGKEYRSLNFSLDLFKPGTPSRTYFNDFSVDSLLGDFIGSGFSVRMESGFDDPAIHSDHNYSDQGEITYQLRTPIIVSENQFLRYKDVVLVEPGESNVAFGNDDFFDYVVVEGSRDGNNWIPIASGYDSNFNPTWLSTYNANGTGSSVLFVEHQFDLKRIFEVDDIIFLRFRLFADPFVNGWGWAIDNVEVYLENTTPVFDEKFESLLFYPNPANEELNILIPSSGKEKTIIISDIQGRKILHDVVPVYKDQVRIQTAFFTEGLYIVEIWQERKLVATEKIIIAH